MSNSLSPLEDYTVSNGKTIQKIKYDCGCEAIGVAPMPLYCPTHGIKPKEEKSIQVAVILDESSSMGLVQDKTIQGFNEYLDGLGRDGQLYRITLSKFSKDGSSSTCEVLYLDEPVSKAPRLSTENYTPHGATPLYDAIGITVAEVSNRVTSDNPVLVIILTDGQENASCEWTRAQIQALIKVKEATGNWTFVYLGANQDAWAVAGQFGMHQGNVTNFATSNVRNVMSNLVRTTSSYAAKASSVGQYMSTSYFADAGIKDINVNSGVSDAATQLGALGGQASAAKLTPEKRKLRAKHAVEARYTK